jgi:glycosyltransferase involved in cell wall biosynthesis
MVCSIIIATCNRAGDLQKTLRCLGDISVPPGLKTELIIADNASTDDTAAVARAAKFKNMEVCYFYEGRKGKGHALNTSLSRARGEIILFTDDDVAPSRDWLEKLGRPLLERKCDGVMGRTDLAPELCRPWMKPIHRLWLAATPETPKGRLELIGANAGIHRSVLDRVPFFDPELGAGGLGNAEDTLFSWQLEEAGFKIHMASDAIVTHSPHPSRLLRSSWLSTARNRGRSLAYLLHHWKHEELKWPGLQSLYLTMKLTLRRRLQPPPAMDQEGAPVWEMSHVLGLETCRQYMIERNRPRNYAKCGLKKTTSLSEKPPLDKRVSEVPAL